MKLKNDYNNCLTNLTCSIQKYFGVEPRHATLKVVDEVLERKQPRNVVVLLYDGMGDNILLRTLPQDSFFLTHRVGRITSVFPATTTAATTTVESGLNPAEHGWLGWNTYLKSIDKVVCLFLETEKGADGSSEEVKNAIKEHYEYKTVVQQINETGNAKAYNVSAFGDVKYKGLDDMADKLEELCKQPGKKYMYVYDNEPDHSMHEYGPDSIVANNLIAERNSFTEKLITRLEDTVLIIVADHGHILAENVFLEDYPEIYELLDRQTSIEPRACAIKVKQGTNAKFEELFNKYLASDFELLTKEEVLEMGLFGDGKQHPDFQASLGDYLVIASDSHKCLMTKEDYPLFSQHAGYNDDEVYVPLIIAEN